MLGEKFISPPFWRRNSQKIYAVSQEHAHFFADDSKPTKDQIRKIKEAQLRLLTNIETQAELIINQHLYEYNSESENVSGIENE